MKTRRPDAARASVSFFSDRVCILKPVRWTGQSIREDGPTWHMSKQGTPTMGGIMFIIAIGAACAVAGWEEIQSGDYKHLYVFLFALVFGAIGMVDDFQKLRHHANEGLTAAQKFLLQLAASIAFTVLMRGEGYLTPNLFVPFLNVTIPLPWVAYMVFAAFVMVGTVNAVNLTDGIDGLATGVHPCGPVLYGRFRLVRPERSGDPLRRPDGGTGRLPDL